MYVHVYVYVYDLLCFGPSTEGVLLRRPTTCLSAGTSPACGWQILKETERVKLMEAEQVAVKRAAGRKLLEEVAKTNAAQIERKKLILQAELEDDARIAAYVRSREEKEAAQQAEAARIAHEKEMEARAARTPASAPHCPKALPLVCGSNFGSHHSLPPAFAEGSAAHNWPEPFLCAFMSVLHNLLRPAGCAAARRTGARQ